jgi:hypothetical protein
MWLCTHLNGAHSIQSVRFILNPELYIYLLPKVTELVSSRDKIRIMKSASVLSITTLSCSRNNHLWLTRAVVNTEKIVTYYTHAYTFIAGPYNLIFNVRFQYFLCKYKPLPLCTTIVKLLKTIVESKVFGESNVGSTKKISLLLLIKNPSVHFYYFSPFYQVLLNH